MEGWRDVWGCGGNVYIEATHGHDVNVCFLQCLEDMDQPEDQEVCGLKSLY